MLSYSLGTSRTGSFTYAGTTPKVATATENGVANTVAYDAAGNELAGGSSSTFTYSSRNLVASDGTNTYTYDGRGVRVLARGPLQGLRPRSWPIIHSTYSPDLHLLTQSLENVRFPTSIEILWLGSLPVVQYVAGPDLLTYTFTDHLGTLLIQTDETAAVLWRAEYEPYGRIPAMRTGAASDQPLRLPGQEAGDSAESYNIFRWYRPGWGRYTQSDPIGLVPTLFGIKNLFGYSDANPLDHSDRVGLYSIGKGCSDTCGPDNVTTAVNDWSCLSHARVRGGVGRQPWPATRAERSLRFDSRSEGLPGCRRPGADARSGIASVGCAMSRDARRVVSR